MAAFSQRLASRLVQTAAVVLIVTFATYWMLSLLPADPCFLSVGTGATEELLAECRENLNLDSGIFSQYGAWLGNMLSGDLGESYRNGIQVTDSLADKLPVTAWLVLYTTVLSIVVSIPLGMLSAVRRDTWVDRLLTGGAFSLLALPSFVLGVVLALVFAAKLGWFNLGGYVGPTSGVIAHWKSLFLPVVTLTAGVMPFFLRLLRSDVITTLQEDYVEAARAKGLPRWWILLRHVLRPSSFTVVTVAGLNAAQLVNGALVVEVIYDLDGMGTFLISAVFNQDFLVVQTLVALIAAGFVATNMLVDAMYPLLDPRSGCGTDEGSHRSGRARPRHPARKEPRSAGVGRLRLAEQSVGFWLAFLWLVGLGFFLLFAPVLGFLADPEGYSREVLQGVGWSHWFGTDELGRDMFARVVWGGRLSLMIAVLAVVLGTLIGGLMGLLAGFFGGWVDTVLSGVINILLALPALILALFIVTVPGAEHPQRGRSGHNSGDPHRGTHRPRADAAVPRPRVRHGGSLHGGPHVAASVP